MQNVRLNARTHTYTIHFGILRRNVGAFNLIIFHTRFWRRRQHEICCAPFKMDQHVNVFSLARRAQIMPFQTTKPELEPFERVFFKRIQSGFTVSGSRRRRVRWSVQVLNGLKLRVLHNIQYFSLATFAVTRRCGKRKTVHARPLA